MTIHEYQAKELLKSFGVTVPRGQIALSPEEAVQAAQSLGGTTWVVKAQIHAGGRGKGGGIQICKSKDEVYEQAKRLLGHPLVTPQTGHQGRIVRRLYIEEGLDIAQELYLSILLDRQRNNLLFISSASGGMDIEELAVKQPDAILQESFDLLTGLQPYHVRHILRGLGLKGDIAKRAGALISSVGQAYLACDASLIEINPLVITTAGEVMALDAKMTIDDNALYRQPNIALLRDKDEENALELQAAQFDLNYIKLDGDIGNMVNGAGLAMATMDIIQHFGGRPANFLDVGGSADRRKVKAAFEIILGDQVKAILVNIFGGIMQCDVIADGIVAAAHNVGLTVPLVVRLQGTNVEIGQKILADSGLSLTMADSMATAAEAVVRIAAQGE